MDDMVKIPTLVRSQLSLYAAEARMKAEQMDAHLKGRPITTTESRRLRGQRDRYVSEAAAWEWLHEIATGDREVDRSPDSVRPASAIDPAACMYCAHPHFNGVACKRHVSPDGAECGCER